MEHFESFDEVLEKHLSWSILCGDPLVFENRMISEKLVAWSGVIMPLRVALCITGTFMNISPTPAQKQALRVHTFDLVNLNAFGSRSKQWGEQLRSYWDITQKEPYDFYRKVLEMNFEKSQSIRLTRAQSMQWIQKLMTS